MSEPQCAGIPAMGVGSADDTKVMPEHDMILDGL
jgi:hypothetical protein